MTTEMIKFDVLAVRGNEAETLHVELAGAVRDGERIDSLTGDRVEVIGFVFAPDASAAHTEALKDFERVL